jgi:hypothetical protein
MPDDRTYIRLHDGFDENPKIAGLSDKEFRTYIEALCYSARNLTDGRISFAVARKLAPPRVWATLVKAGLMEHHHEHYSVHDYLEHQRSAEQVRQLRAARREAGKRGGQAKANALASARGVASDLVKQTPSKPVPDTEAESSVPKGTARTSRARAPQGDGNPTAQTVLAAWIDRQPRPPAGQVKGQVAQRIKALLGEDFTVGQIHAALNVMDAKGLNPSALPSLVTAAANDEARQASLNQVPSWERFADTSSPTSNGGLKPWEL